MSDSKNPTTQATSIHPRGKKIETAIGEAVVVGAGNPFHRPGTVFYAARPKASAPKVDG